MNTKEILEKHKAWLLGYSGGVRADLRDANLRDANISGADLRGANISGADLRDADISGANISGADLRDANISGADLRGANISGADLRGANISGANISGADISGANISGANLRGANISGADLRKAIIDAVAAARILVPPQSGAFEGWKKCESGVLVRLRIPEKAARSSATTRKCRAEYVRVLEVIGAKVGVSLHDGTTKYIAGKTVRADAWEPDRWIECAGGIHFYLTREEAEAHS